MTTGNEEKLALGHTLAEVDDGMPNGILTDCEAYGMVSGCGYRIVVSSDYDDEDTNHTPFVILYVHELQHALRLRRIEKEIIL